MIFSEFSHSTLDISSEMGRYDDIINLSHHVSSTHPHMPMHDRAVQFMPFRALTGYEDAVQEAARLTEKKSS